MIIPIRGWSRNLYMGRPSLKCGAHQRARTAILDQNQGHLGPDGSAMSLATDPLYQPLPIITIWPLPLPTTPHVQIIIKYFQPPSSPTYDRNFQKRPTTPTCILNHNVTKSSKGPRFQNIITILAHDWSNQLFLPCNDDSYLYSWWPWAAIPPRLMMPVSNM